MLRIVYSPQYNFRLFGAERLHPFDAKKYGRVWRCLERHFGDALPGMSLSAERPARHEDLLTVHTASYLDELRQPKYVARAIEVPPAQYLPRWLIDRCILRPMRWAAMGTVVAAREALRSGLAVNLGGGFHHAKPDSGEGFCIYSDIALAVGSLRTEGLLAEDARIAYVDLDAHQGNGVCHAFLRDSSVFIFDMYNANIYPAHDTEARERIDCDVRIASGCDDAEYHYQLKHRLPGFLDSITRDQPIALAIYNAGTDVFEGDPLGGLNLSAGAILRRDEFVAQELRQREIPMVMVLSGGYTKASYRLVADSVIRLQKMETQHEDRR